MPPSLRCSSLWAAPSVSAHFDPHCAGRRPVRLGHGLLAGLVFGAVALLSGDAGLFLAADPGGAIVTVLSKGIACGAAAGLCCRWLHPRYPRLSILLSALAVPLVNAGGVSAGLPTVFHAPHPSVGTAGGLCQRRSYLMAGMVGCPCTLVITGGLGRFVAPLCRREAVYDEDLLLRGLWKLCTANCPSADKPEKRSIYKWRLGTTSPQPPFFCPTTGRAGLTERTPAPPMRRR